MSEQIQYQNIFDFELIPKTGITDVISGDRLRGQDVLKAVICLLPFP